MDVVFSGSTYHSAQCHSIGNSLRNLFWQRRNEHSLLLSTISLSQGYKASVLRYAEGFIRIQEISFRVIRWIVSDHYVFFPKYEYETFCFKDEFIKNFWTPEMDRWHSLCEELFLWWRWSDCVGLHVVDTPEYKWGESAEISFLGTKNGWQWNYKYSSMILIRVHKCGDSFEWHIW